MKNFVFIVTSNENHWYSMTQQLKRKGISFYPNNKEELDNLGALCDCSHFSKTDAAVKKADIEIMEIVKNLPERLFCLLISQIKEVFSAHEDGILFSWFYEKFLINNPDIKPIIYFQFGDNCICDSCCEKRKKQQNEAIIYCKEKNFPYFYWSQRGEFFTKDRHKMMHIPRKELSLPDIIEEL